MNEAFLQYIWQHRLLEGPLTTVEGLPVVVERPGELNRDAGPDFIDARITIDGLRWAGNVEIHVRASDWNLHKHSKDKNYNNVILHVVYIHDADIVLENGKRVSTMEIAGNVPEKAWDNYNALMHPRRNMEIPCAERLKEIPDFLFQLSQDRLVVERLERKSSDVQRILDETKGSWEQACYWLTAHYFGGKSNAFPFELLAKVTPMTVLAKIKDNPFRVESLFFGQSGLLEGDFEDDYPKSMQREYNYLSAAYKLKPIDGFLWKYFRIYPSGFPTIRISQFSNLIVRSSNLFSKLLEARDVETLRQLFDVQASEYWESHYRFDVLSNPRKKTIGSSFVNTLLINAWVPLLFQYGVMHGDETRKEQAFELLRQLPAEHNRIVGYWQKEGVNPSNAAESQALIQRYTEYCKGKECLKCQLAFRLIKN